MASPLENALRLVRPGEMVVPVSDILDKLGSKLTATEKEQLLIAILSRRTDQVKPGDLITAGLLNQLLADVADLQVRVAELSKGGKPGGTTVQILDPNPSTTLRIGDPLVISGLNFGTAPTVMLAEAPIKVEQGSNDRALFIKSIPIIQNIPENGRQVLLTVTNPSIGSASTTLKLAPPVLTKPEGRLEVWRSGTVNATKLIAGQTYTFPYRIRAVADMDETYNLRASVDAGWPAVTVDKPDLTGREITSIPISKGTVLVDGTTVDIAVRVTIPAGTANNISGRMSLTATSQKNPGLYAPSQDTILVVDKPPPDAQAIAVSVNSITPPGEIETPVGKKPVIKVPATGQTLDEVDVTFLATIPGDGKYTIQTPLTFVGNSQGWSATVVGASTGIPWTGPDESFVVTIKANVNATAEAKLKLKVVSDNDSKVFGETEQDVKVK